MPTIKQLEINRIFDRMFRLSEMDHYGDEHLSYQEETERKHKTQSENVGEILGYLKWDEEKQDMVFTPVNN